MLSHHLNTRCVQAFDAITVIITDLLCGTHAVQSFVSFSL